MAQRLTELVASCCGPSFPSASCMAAVAIASNVVVGGWNWTLKPLSPKFGKLNPVSGLLGLFSKQKLIGALKACGLALVLGVIGALYLKSHIDAFGGVIALPLPAALRRSPRLCSAD